MTPPSEKTSLPVNVPVATLPPLANEILRMKKTVVSPMIWEQVAFWAQVGVSVLPVQRAGSK